MVPEISSATDITTQKTKTTLKNQNHPNNPKNQNFEKMKKTPEDVIILHQCTKNYDHMVYCS